MPQAAERYFVSILVIIAGLLYAPALRAPFVFDDIPKIALNRDIQEPGKLLSRLVYPYDASRPDFNRNDPSRPLTYLTFGLNYRFCGLEPLCYHLFNLFVHVCVAYLIFLLSARLLPLIFGTPLPYAAEIAALIFLIHPVNTNVVAYTFARSDALATLFYLAGMIFFLRTARSGGSSAVLTVLAFLPGLASKPNAITFPVMAFLCDWIVLSRGDIRQTYRRFRLHAALWFTAALYLAFRQVYLGGIGDVESVAPGTISGYDYFLTQLKVTWRYIYEFVMPTGICIDHCPPVITEVGLRVWLFVAFDVAVIAALWRWQRRGTAAGRLALFTACWFAVTLAPTSSFFPLTTFMDDKRLYLASVGLCIALGYVYAVFMARQGRLRMIALSAFVFQVAFLSVLTVRASLLYRDPVLLWEDVVAKYSENYRGQDTLGTLYGQRGKYPEALAHYHRALSLNPRSAKTFANMGLVHALSGNAKMAQFCYERAIDIDGNYALAHYNLGILFESLGRSGEALEEVENALRIEPGNRLFRTRRDTLSGKR